MKNESAIRKVDTLASVVGKWPLGRVVWAYSNQFGNVRSVIVKIAGKLYDRSGQRTVRLLTSDSDLSEAAGGAEANVLAILACT